MKPADREPYQTANQVAAWVGVEADTIRFWARTRVIRGYQPGGRVWLFLASEVAEDIARSAPLAPVVSIAEELRRVSPPAYSDVPTLDELRRRAREGYAR